MSNLAPRSHRHTQCWVNNYLLCNSINGQLESNIVSSFHVFQVSVLHFWPWNWAIQYMLSEHSFSTHPYSQLYWVCCRSLHIGHDYFVCCCTGQTLIYSISRLIYGYCIRQMLRRPSRQKCKHVFLVQVDCEQSLLFPSVIVYRAQKHRPRRKWDAPHSVHKTYNQMITVFQQFQYKNWSIMN